MKDFILLLPEIFLGLTLAGIIAGEIGYYGEKVRLITATALAGLAGAFVQSWAIYRHGDALVWGQDLSVDALSLFFKMFFILLAGLTIVASIFTKEVDSNKRAEFCALVVASTLAMGLAACSADMLLGFLVLQFMNVVSYCLAAYGKRSSLSTEAAMKHLVLGSASSALFLFGLALLFAHTRTLNIYEMHHVLQSNPIPVQTGLVIFILMFSAFCYQFGAFPMHLASPDVLEGSPTVVSSFLSLGSRVAGFAMALRFFVVVFAKPVLEGGATDPSSAQQWTAIGGFQWQQIVALASGATMLVGALLALRQSGAKRLISYLVMAESGFLLMGLLVLDQSGVAALLYSLLIQLFALVGAFSVVGFLLDEIESDRLSDLHAALSRSIPECISLILFLVCLVGLPPFPGFIGKFVLIGSVIHRGWYLLAAAGVITMAISTAAVARLAFSLVRNFKDAGQFQWPRWEPRRVYLMALLLPLLLIGFFAEPLLAWTAHSARFILW
ncbi:hypothetical protein K2X30_01945 [bacterium]|jgi:NADH-quinone oxidoreductase subunit N|nr:hypothetical protein [bacterium]